MYTEYRDPPKFAGTFSPSIYRKTLFQTAFISRPHGNPGHNEILENAIVFQVAFLVRQEVARI